MTKFEILEKTRWPPYPFQWRKIVILGLYKKRFFGVNNVNRDLIIGSNDRLTPHACFYRRIFRYIKYFECGPYKPLKYGNQPKNELEFKI